ncbi:putative polyADP ribose glycohydrolase [Blattamonas nauphoetae]|uniref:PolyADP ribose glycohydrolase n=1 Tax=Blattamonas nauphoetae TaxID=2049346 RepID=A0ABQ9WX40_9EUKA|nr:putative polyADP ribose glycohydrolase [Blattamonas nauphoetae]
MSAISHPHAPKTEILHVQMPWEARAEDIQRKEKWSVLEKILSIRPFGRNELNAVLTLNTNKRASHQLLTAPSSKLPNASFNIPAIIENCPRDAIRGFDEYLKALSEPEQQAIQTVLLSFMADCFLQLRTQITSSPYVCGQYNTITPPSPKTELEIPFLMKHHAPSPQSRTPSAPAPFFSTQMVSISRILTPGLLAGMFFCFFHTRPEIIEAEAGNYRLFMPNTTFADLLEYSTRVMSSNSSKSILLLDQTSIVFKKKVQPTAKQLERKQARKEARKNTRQSWKEKKQAKRAAMEARMAEGTSESEDPQPSPSSQITPPHSPSTSTPSPAAPSKPTSSSKVHIHPASVTKLNCLFHFFHRVHSSGPLSRQLEVQRRSMDKTPDWAESRKTLCRVLIDIDGRVEDTPPHHFKVDFANRFLGGGVLRHGAVQEEILLSICPEGLIPMLFLEEHSANEASLIVNAERFCQYKGYQMAFAFNGPFHEEPESEVKSRMIVMDATNYSGPPTGRNEVKNQWSKTAIDRELNKALTGFSFVTPGESLCTGHWGCGAYRGDRVMKFLLQWMAASEQEVGEMQWCGMEEKADILRVMSLAEHLARSRCTPRPRDGPSEGSVGVTAHHPELIEEYTSLSPPSPLSPTPASTPPVTVGDLYRALLVFCQPFSSAAPKEKTSLSAEERKEAYLSRVQITRPSGQELVEFLVKRFER